MENHWCVSANHTTLNLMRYDPPGNAVPLGISAITLVCLTCIFLDISNGYRRNKPWIPCEWFTLNSLTLSLVSLAATYPSNRTTLMVSAEGQLCKLSGTVLISICMGFLMPSIGVEGGPDSIKNMASLTILVVTVQYNVIAQMFTGAIFSFLFEHLVVLFFMFVMLLMMWTMCFAVIKAKREFSKGMNSLFGSPRITTTNQMLSMLESCHTFGYTCNSQVVLGTSTHCATIGLICTLSALGLLEAVVGTLVVTERKLCDRSYKSGWGLRMLLGIQILTIIVSVLAIGFRWFTVIRHLSSKKDDFPRERSFESIFRNLYPLPWTLSRTFYFRVFQLRETLLSWTLTKTAEVFELATNSVLSLSLWLGHSFQCGEPRDIEFNSSRVQHFGSVILLRGHKKLVDWILRTAVYDMDRFTSKCTMKPPANLIQLLLRRPPEPSMFEELEIFLALETNKNWSESRYKVSSFSVVVILVRLLEVLIPSCSRFLTSALNECFDLLYLIGMNDQGEEGDRLILAQDLWMCTNFKSHWFYKKFLGPSLRRRDNQTAPQAPVQVALQVIEEIIKIPVDENLQCFDLFAIAKIISFKDFDSLDKLYDFFEILFVQMIYSNLKKIPSVIDNYVWKSSVEECGDRARYVMKMICKVQQLEDRIGRLDFKIDEGDFHSSSDDSSDEDYSDMWSDGDYSTPSTNHQTSEFHKEGDFSL